MTVVGPHPLPPLLLMGTGARDREEEGGGVCRTRTAFMVRRGDPSNQSWYYQHSIAQQTRRETCPRPIHQHRREEKEEEEEMEWLSKTLGLPAHQQQQQQQPAASPPPHASKGADSQGALYLSDGAPLGGVGRRRVSQGFPSSSAYHLDDQG